jgi:hypothetical protein
VRTVKTGGETAYRQMRRQSRQKPLTFFAALCAGFSENSRLCRRGWQSRPKKRGTVALSASVLFFLSLLWYIETSHDRSRPAEHPTAWSQGEV